MARKTTRLVSTTPEERIQEHKRQMLLQVWLPLAVGSALVLAVCILAILGTIYRNPEINRWGNISAVYLLIPNLLVNLIPLLLLSLAIYGMKKLIAKMPAWMHALQDIFVRIYTITRKAADKLAAPVLAAGGFNEGLKAARRKITR